MPSVRSAGMHLLARALPPVLRRSGGGGGAVGPRLQHRPAALAAPPDSAGHRTQRCGGTGVRRRLPDHQGRHAGDDLPRGRRRHLHRHQRRRRTVALAQAPRQSGAPGAGARRPGAWEVSRVGYLRLGARRRVLLDQRQQAGYAAADRGRRRLPVPIVGPGALGVPASVLRLRPALDRRRRRLLLSRLLPAGRPARADVHQPHARHAVLRRPLHGGAVSSRTPRAPELGRWPQLCPGEPAGRLRPADILGLAVRVAHAGGPASGRLGRRDEPAAGAVAGFRRHPGHRSGRGAAPAAAEPAPVRARAGGGRRLPAAGGAGRLPGAGAGGGA